MHCFSQFNWMLQGVAGVAVQYLGYTPGLFIVGLFAILILWMYANFWITGTLLVVGGMIFLLVFCVTRCILLMIGIKERRHAAYCSISLVMYTLLLICAYLWWFFFQLCLWSHTIVYFISSFHQFSPNKEALIFAIIGMELNSFDILLGQCRTSILVGLIEYFTLFNPEILFSIIHVQVIYSP